ncbi:hypothetical protein Fcan01_22989 [Folsomia candida]|uniref:Uncharacterized protein n=1 Tax=Folsomia candida TaxID=158441 RepID=A0A226DA20_FOLCA|nr:hypothetical protein Fcan01_22989 [Folsomia candida]
MVVSVGIVNVEIVYSEPRELFLSPTLAQVTGFTKTHFTKSGAYIAESNVVESLSSIPPETIFQLSLGLREPFTVTMKEPETYTLASFLDSMAQAFREIPKLRIGITKQVEVLMVRFTIFSKGVNFKFSPFISNLFAMSSDFVLDQVQNDLFIPAYLFNLAPPVQPKPPTPIPAIGQLWVHCDLSGEHLIGGQTYPVIRILPPTYSLGQTVTMTFDPVRFSTVSRTELSSMNLKITDEYNQILTEQVGQTSATLHLRRKLI